MSYELALISEPLTSPARDPKGWLACINQCSEMLALRGHCVLASGTLFHSSNVQAHQRGERILKISFSSQN
jgi:hypothetical protein